MNKIKFLIAVAIVAIGSSAANAQKMGYISVDQAISIMPEVPKIDTMLQKYQRDSVNTEFASLVQEYNYKDSMLNKTDTSKTPKAVLNQYRQSLQEIAYQVQNWQQISQQAVQAKQNELLAPVYQKLMATIQTVAKENGYSHVFNKEAFLVAPPGDDLLPLVAKKLNIKLPNEQGNPNQQRPPTNTQAKPKGKG